LYPNIHCSQWLTRLAIDKVDANLSAVDKDHKIMPFIPLYMHFLKAL